MTLTTLAFNRTADAPWGGHKAWGHNPRISMAYDIRHLTACRELVTGVHTEQLGKYVAHSKPHGREFRPSLN